MSDELLNKTSLTIQHVILIFQRGDSGRLATCPEMVGSEGNCLPYTSELMVNRITRNYFTPVTEVQLAKLIGKSVRKSCDLDPIPATVLKECLTDLLPVITKIVNVSVTEAVVPSSLKNASLHPLLKKQTLPYEEFSSFRPVSNLAFISKCVEKVVAAQTCQHVEDNNLNELYQSAYKQYHSTETAMIKVQDDILRAIDNNCCVILLLLDLSAAFDTVDHRILLDRLSQRFGIVDNALEWFRSYLSDRHQVVKVNGSQSSRRKLRCGVPQGSVLGPILFLLYTSPLGDIMRYHQVKFHLYADDTQLYLTFKSPPEMAKTAMEACVRDIDTWMTANMLKMNRDKTELLVLKARHRPLPPLTSISVCDEDIDLSSKARNIGVIFDTSMSMENHITAICKSAFYHLRNISNSDFAVTNSAHFVSTINSETILDSEIMVSFDVESLFTNVPIDGAVQAALRKLGNDPSLADRTTLTPAQIADLLNFVLRSTYFQYNGSIYEQQEGAAMGSPVSAVVANLYMESFEEQAITSSSYKPKI
ncbi:hypothetical protein ACROYT_G035496 [Oculina patagonica]